jgi:uncharacterized protein
MQPLDQETMRSVRAFISMLPPEFQPSEVVVFGSRARHEHRPGSDADVAVILLGPAADRIAVALSMADVAFDVMLDAGILIEAVPLWEAEWRTPAIFSNPSLIENIKRQGIRL